MSPRAPRGSAIPAIRRCPFSGASAPVTALSESNCCRSRLSAVSRVMPGVRAGRAADAIYSINRRWARSWRPMPSATGTSSPFFYSGPGRTRAPRRYVNTVEAITPLKLVPLPTESLTSLLRGNPELQFKVLCRVTQKLRISASWGYHRTPGSPRAHRDAAGVMEDRSRWRQAPVTSLGAAQCRGHRGVRGRPGPAVSRVFRDLERHGILQREGRT